MMDIWVYKERNTAPWGNHMCLYYKGKFLFSVENFVKEHGNKQNMMKVIKYLLVHQIDYSKVDTKGNLDDIGIEDRLMNNYFIDIILFALLYDDVYWRILEENNPEDFK